MSNTIIQYKVTVRSGLSPTLSVVFKTHKQLETHRYMLSTVATDGLALKHQAISTHSADYIFIVLD